MFIRYVHGSQNRAICCVAVKEGHENKAERTSSRLNGRRRRTRRSKERKRISISIFGEIEIARATSGMVAYCSHLFEALFERWREALQDYRRL
jgi:hypothetical protein